MADFDFSGIPKADTPSGYNFSGIDKATDKGTVIYRNTPTAPMEGSAAALAAKAVANAPAIANAVRTVATPDNLGYVSTAYGIARSASDLSEGHPLDALEHAILGSTPLAVVKAIEKMHGPRALQSQDVLNYAKAAGERLNPANVVPNPTVGGAVDQYATSMGQRVVRLLGPNGEVLNLAPARVASKASTLFDAVAPWLNTVGNVTGMLSSEADSQNEINSARRIAELSTHMTDAARAKLLSAYRSKPEYLQAIEAANR